MQFKEANRVGPDFRKWADLSWELSQLSISNRCKTVLQEGPFHVDRYFRVNLYGDLAALYEDVELRRLTPAQAYACAASHIYIYHSEYHRLVNSDLYIEAILNNPNATIYSYQIETMLNRVLQ